MVCSQVCFRFDELANFAKRFKITYRENTVNQTMIQYFHWYTQADASLWQEVAEQAGYLADLGITLAWLPPAYKGSEGQNSVGYDVYDLFDLGEFE